LFPILDGIRALISGGEIKEYISTAVDFSKFSLTYTCLLMFLVLYPIVNKKDLTFFTKMSAYGVIFIVSQILFVVGIAIYSMTNTPYNLSMTTAPEEHNIAMFKTNFYPLAGVLAAGYYLHSLGLPIIRQNKH
jgi:hypothetical protein